MSIHDHPGARHVTRITPGRIHFAGGVGKIARAMYGAELMLWQVHVARLETEQLDDGSWAYRCVVVTVPRQAGKTTLRGPLIIHRCLTKQYARCWFTAQTRQDARDTVVEEVIPRFQRTAFASLAKPRESQGSEGLYFRDSTGSSYRIFPPREGGLDGKANERVDVDESWRIDAVTGAALDNSIQPTFTTTGGQFGMVSTAGTVKSSWLRGYVLQGRQAVKLDQRTGTALVEFGVPDDVAAYVRELLEAGAYGPKFDEAVQLLAMHNPAYGYTLGPGTPAGLGGVEGGVRAMLANPDEGGIDGVLRAYGNHWTKTAMTLIPEHLYNACVVDELPPAADTAALAIAAGIDRTDAAIVTAWRDHTGRPWFRVVDHREGISWLPAAAAEQRRGRRMGCAGAGPVLELADTAERRHAAGAIDRLTERDYGTACAQVLTLILEGIAGLDASPALRAAAEVATQRRLGDGGWAWDRTGSAGSIATLEAATVALWEFDHGIIEPLPAVY